MHNQTVIFRGDMDFNILVEKVNFAVNEFYSRDSKLLVDSRGTQSLSKNS